jgi:hypothetical protein
MSRQIFAGQLKSGWYREAGDRTSIRITFSWFPDPAGICCHGQQVQNRLFQDKPVRMIIMGLIPGGIFGRTWRINFSYPGIFFRHCFSLFLLPELKITPGMMI